LFLSAASFFWKIIWLYPRLVLFLQEIFIDMKRKLVYSDILRTVWKALLSQIWLLAGLTIGITIIISLLFIFAVPAKGETLRMSGIVVFAICFFLCGIFYMGFLKNCFQTLDGEEAQFSAYGQVSRKIIEFIVAYIILSIIVFVGTLFLVIPGIYLALRLQFFVAAMVEDNAGIFESLKRSWDITRGYTLDLFVLSLISIAIFMIGMIAFLAGIFVAAPMTELIYCATYRKLTSPIAT